MIDLFKKNKEALLKFEQLTLTKEKLAITVFSKFEIIIQLINKKEAKEVISFLNSIRIYEFSKEAVDFAGQIYNLLKKKGEMISLNDIYISSIALLNKEPILTKDIKHFKKVSGLIVESY